MEINKMFNYIAFSLALISLVLGAGLLLQSRIHSDRGTMLPMIIGYLVVIISIAALILAVFCGYKRFEFARTLQNQLFPQTSLKVLSGCPFLLPTILPDQGGANIQNQQNIADFEKMFRKVFEDVFTKKTTGNQPGVMQQPTEQKETQPMQMNQNTNKTGGNQIQPGQTSSQVSEPSSTNKLVAA